MLTWQDLVRWEPSLRDYERDAVSFARNAKVDFYPDWIGLCTWLIADLDRLSQARNQDFRVLHKIARYHLVDVS